jgi:hypothetical protein
MAVGVTMATACLVGRHLPKSAFFQGLDGPLHTRFRRQEHLHPGVLQPSQGPPPQPPTDQCIDGPNTQKIQGPARTVNVVGAPVPNSVHLSGFRIHKGEEGRTAKMIAGCAGQTGIVQCGNADSHIWIVSFFS